MNIVKTVDPDIFRFMVTNMMAALLQRTHIDMASGETVMTGMSALGDAAMAGAQQLLTKIEGVNVLLVDDGHVVMGALTSFNSLSESITDPLHPAVAEGELVEAAFALALDAPERWTLDELGLPMPTGDDIAQLGRPLMLCRAAALLMVEAARLQRLDDVGATAH